MAAAPETPESPVEEVRLHLIPLSTVLGDEEGRLDRGAARLWLDDYGRGFLEILGAIARTEHVSADLRSAGAYLAMDLQRLVEALHRAEAGERVRVVEAREWQSRLDRSDRLRDLAALASSAADLFEDAYSDARLPYQSLASALSKRLAEDREAAR